MNPILFVTVVIPCRNEDRFIAKCLDSVLANDYPKDQLETLVVDGMSEDYTREIVRKYEDLYPFVKVVENPKKIIPAAMNIGIRTARGDIIVKIDAHSTYASDYISKCVKFLTEYDADNVGGVLVTEPNENTPVAKAIALVLAHSFGSGNSHFRVGSREPRWSDTAAFGCYRRDVFKRVGFYNEDLVRSSDMDLNTRLRRAGGKILLVPEIVAYYYPRSRLGDFFVRNIVDGFWALYPLKFGGQVVRLRHVVPLVCLLIFLAGLAAVALAPVLWWVLLAFVCTYAALALGVSAHIAWRERKPWLVVLLPVVFGVRHLAYAIGSLWGIVRAVLSRSFWRGLRDGSQWREASV
jgi:cellulose synthase/poly-beta-1,6-N-acetylglucosamine synthase-like glycosyltransferase